MSTDDRARPELATPAVVGPEATAAPTTGPTRGARLAEPAQRVPSNLARAVALAAKQPLTAESALAIAALPADQRDAITDDLTAAAATRRDRHWGRIVTFSPKVFLPLTNLCRNFCDYCSFRRSPGQPGAWTMTPTEVETWLERGHKLSCVEALFCLGDTPEGVFRPYRDTLASFGHQSTVDYLVWAGQRGLDRGLLPHTNAGILSGPDMKRLKAVNPSLGLMLENVSPRLCERGMPHHRAPDKRPEKRLAMMRTAGELHIPFTSGVLLGIGETETERVESLLALRDLQREHGHIQEVIVQSFRARPEIPMHAADEATPREVVRAIALARLILDDEVAVQVPPNLTPGTVATLLGAGVSDFGGISPVTPDYINPRHSWPHLGKLAQACRAAGSTLRPRPPVYETYLERPGFVDDAMRAHVRATSPRLAALQAELDASVGMATDLAQISHQAAVARTVDAGLAQPE